MLLNNTQKATATQLHSCSSTICFFFSDTKGTVPGFECALLLASLQNRKNQHFIKKHITVVSLNIVSVISNHEDFMLHNQYNQKVSFP
jgi:hypothetical protein